CYLTYSSPHHLRFYSNDQFCHPIQNRRHSDTDSHPLNGKSHRSADVISYRRFQFKAVFHSQPKQNSFILLHVLPCLLKVRNRKPRTVPAAGVFAFYLSVWARHLAISFRASLSPRQIQRAVSPFSVMM